MRRCVFVAFRIPVLLLCARGCVCCAHRPFSSFTDKDSHDLLACLSDCLTVCVCVCVVVPSPSQANDARFDASHQEDRHLH